MPTTTQRQTSGQRVVDTLWPEGNLFATAWGFKTRRGLAASVDTVLAADTLHAAAPLLLEALKTVELWTQYGVPNARQDALRRTINTAIAAAEGGRPL